MTAIISEQFKKISLAELFVIPFILCFLDKSSIAQQICSNASEFTSGTRSPLRYLLNVAGERPDTSLISFAVHSSFVI
ncbi:MAG: hypothetical protein PUD24_07915 [Oscillospiraceae bacterium]|nr:hypothetical protein [Oscillospiraceae bacterium]